MITKLQLTVAKFEGELDAVKDERGHLRNQLAEEQKQRIDAERRAAAAEAKLEQIENQIAISVVHSQAVADGGEEENRPLGARYHHHGPYDIYIIQEADPETLSEQIARQMAETKAQRQAHAQRRAASWPDGTRDPSVIRQRELIRRARQNGWRGQPPRHPVGDEDVRVKSFRK